MSAVLVISRDKKQLNTVALTTESAIIGRSKQSEVCLDDPDVSRQHTMIRVDAGRYFLRDNGSSNGTLVNGRKITEETEIKEGDVITVGPFMLAFHADEAAAAQGAAEEEEPATRFISAKQIDSKLPGRKVVRKTEAGDLHVKLVVLDGPLEGGTFEDWQGDLTIGRGLDNHVVLMDDAVTTYHARIFEKPDGFYIEDLGSHNGTFMQGVKVTTAKLPPTAKIRIGITTLQFKQTDTAKQKKLMMTAVKAGVVLIVLMVVLKMLMPGNDAEVLTMEGRELYRTKNYTEAAGKFQKALDYDSSYEPARTALKDVKSILEADQVLARAAAAAEEGRFEDAVTIAETAIRIAPAYRVAAKLKENIKAMGEAEVAFTGRNWSDSVRLYKSIGAEYPESKLVPARLAIAASEFNSHQALATASNQVQHEQFGLARQTLQTIPTQSVYRAAAQQMVAGIQWREQVSSVLATDDVTKLRQTLDLMVKGQDPLTALGLTTEDLKAKLTERLRAISVKLAAEGKEQIRLGKRNDGFRFYEKSLEADPANTEAKQASDAIRLMVRNECAVFIRDAKKFESLGQNASAAEALQKIITAGIPGEDYYEYAKSKIPRLKP